MKNHSIILFVSLLVFLTACDNTGNISSQQESKQITTNLENVSWLRNKLPGDTLAYLRLPSLWQLFFEAKGDALHPVQSLEHNQLQLENIKAGFIETFGEFMPPEAVFPVKTIVQNMVTPLEIAITNATDKSMVPNTLIATTLKQTSLKDLSALIESVSNVAGSQVSIINNFDDEGKASLMVTMMPVYLSFEESSGRLAIFSGLTASQKGLTALLAQKTHASELDKIMSFENSVDQSGKNMELWLNIEAIYEQNKGFIPSSEMQMVSQFGLDQMEFLWLGSASKNGKSEFIMHLAMPDVGVRKFMPKVNSVYDFETAGNPRSVWQFAMPSMTQIQQGFNWAMSFNEDSETLKQQVYAYIEKINQFLTVPLNEIYGIYGQKLVMVTDDSGTWFASKINDKQAHDEMLSKLSQAFKTQSSQKTLAGVKINESVFSTKEFETLVFGDDQDEPEILSLLDMKQYMYYQIEGDYLIQALTPQVLADRANSNNKQKLSHWLTSQQVDWDSSIFAYSAEVRDIQRDSYHTYLTVVHFLANFVNLEIDLFAFPTAQQLQLPNKGRFGFAMDSSNDAMTLRLSYEYSLFESMSVTSTYLSLVVIGVLGAYAIPAYEDYSVRAKVSEKLFYANSDKAMISEYFIEHSTFPSSEFTSQVFTQSEDKLYNPKNGELTIYISENGSTSEWIKLTPKITESGDLTWQCSSNMKINQIPLTCRY
ncbi:MAG: pilin [Marinicellaceae bacterium]